jgi:hypothetical protein
MTNIWTKSFEEVRKPFFEMEDPYTLREKKEKEQAKRWWDDDGDGIGYEEGEVSGKFKKKKVKKEGVEIDEAQVARNNPEKYEREQSKKYAPVRGEKTPMPPRGNKRREDFERWYRANVKEDYIGEVNDSKETKLDVKKGIKNKVVISPQIKEELETWIGELVEEGYDLSKFTWQEMLEIYESAEFIDEGTAGMPAAGDAQTVTVDPLAAAKAKAAKAKVAKERADLQVAQQSQRMKVSANESFDSIVEYLSQRPNAFENLEEEVFNPKKSKMRPASERSQRSMTDTQRKAAKKEAERTAKIHSRGETVLAGMRSSGTKGKVKTSPAPKPEAPKANRKVKGRYDKLAKAASDVLKDIKK